MATNVVALQGAQHLAVNRPPVVPRSIALSCDDSPYRLSSWSAADAVRGLAEDERRQLPAIASAVAAANNPCDRRWLKGRLSSMALAFGHDRDVDKATAWLAETGRLLLDLPQDILDQAIDQAIKRADRGFMPAVGQIRAIADPLAEARARQADRLARMAELAADAAPAACRPVDEPPADEDLIDPAEVEISNARMRRMGLDLRFRADGTSWFLKPGEIDPTLPD